jgi:hypothetical protein
MKIFTSFFLTLVISLSTFAQDYPSSRSYIWLNISTSAGTISKHFLNSCSPQLMGVTNFYPGGSCFAGATLYTVNTSSPYQLYTVDTTTGVHTLVANVTNVPMANITGLAWDPAANTMYASVTSMAMSQIATINLSTGAMTPIGSATAVAAGVIAIANSLTGNFLYAVDIVADNLYRFNKTTGVATLVGALPISVNNQTDIQVDLTDNMYYTLNNSQLLVGQFPGGGTLVCTFTNPSYTAFAIKSYLPAPPPVTLCRNGLFLVIPDLFPRADSILVTLGPGGFVHDVDVKVDTFVHTWDSDVMFYLRRPVNSAGSKIINRVGGSGDNFIHTVLDDEASIPIASGTPPFTGSFIPSNPLTPFDGPFNSGYWYLWISDTIGPDSGYLRAWCLLLTATTSVGGIQTFEIPNHYVLSQNYPNPFNPTTKIKFGIPQAGNVKLSVYDVLGREVRVLVNEFKQPNTYEVDFDGTNLPSGVYFYKLQSDDFATTKKMLMLK